MATSSGTFTLRETQAALREWCLLTGLDVTSPTWGEVWQVLSQSGLLEADRNPQRTLFDPDAALGDTPGVRRLCLAIQAGVGIRTHPLAGRDPVNLDPATGTAVVAALMEHHYSEVDRLSFERALTLLNQDLPQRVLGIYDTPGQALGDQLGVEVGTLLNRPDMTGVPDIIMQVIGEAIEDDRFAERVFRALAEHEFWRLALVPLCHGQWVVFRCAPQV